MYTHPSEKQCTWQPDSTGSIILSRTVTTSDISAGTIVDYNDTNCYRNDSYLTGDDYATLTASQLPGNYGSNLYDVATFGNIVIAIIDNSLYTFKYTETDSNYRTGGHLAFVDTALSGLASSNGNPRIHPFGDDYILNSGSKSLWYVVGSDHTYAVSISSDGIIRSGSAISQGSSERHIYCALDQTHLVDTYIAWYDDELYVKVLTVFDSSGNPANVTQVSETSIADYGNLRNGSIGVAAYCGNNRILIWWLYEPSSDNNQTNIEYVEFDSSYKPTLLDHYSLETTSTIRQDSLETSFGAESIIMNTNTVKIFATTNVNTYRWCCLTVTLSENTISGASLSTSSGNVRCAFMDQNQIYLSYGGYVDVYNKSGAMIKQYPLAQGNLEKANVIYFPLTREINNNGYLLVVPNSSGQPNNNLEHITYGATDASKIHYWSSITNQSTMGIALNSANVGESCNIAVDGIVSASWATAQQTIENEDMNPSVSAISPETGYLHIKAKYSQ